MHWLHEPVFFFCFCLSSKCWWVWDLVSLNGVPHTHTHMLCTHDEHLAGCDVRHCVADVKSPKLALVRYVSVNVHAAATTHTHTYICRWLSILVSSYAPYPCVIFFFFPFSLCEQEWISLCVSQMLCSFQFFFLWFPCLVAAPCGSSSLTFAKAFPTLCHHHQCFCVEDYACLLSEFGYALISFLPQTPFLLFICEVFLVDCAEHILWPQALPLLMFPRRLWRALDFSIPFFVCVYQALKSLHLILFLFVFVYFPIFRLCESPSYEKYSLDLSH